MKLEGILLFVGLAVLIEALVGVLFTLPYFQTGDEKIPYLKFFIKLLFAESITLSTVFLVQAVMIFGYFGIVIFPYLDAGLSGLLIAGGVDVVKKIYQDIVENREDVAYLDGQNEILKEKLSFGTKAEISTKKGKK